MRVALALAESRSDSARQVYVPESSSVVFVMVSDWSDDWMNLGSVSKSISSPSLSHLIFSSRSES